MGLHANANAIDVNKTMIWGKWLIQNPLGTKSGISF